MKGNKKIQHHPGQEDKTGKATYASSTGTNSSTVQPAVADYRFNATESGKRRDVKKRERISSIKSNK